MADSHHTGGRRRAVLLGVPVALLALTATPYAFSAVSQHAIGSGGAQITNQQNGGEPFTIRAKVVKPVWLGKLVPINLAFLNPNSAPLQIGGIKVTKLSVTAPNASNAHPCTLADFRIKQAGRGTTVVVDANSKINLQDAGVHGRKWPAVGLYDRPVNQDGCLGATVSLGYSAKVRPQ